MRRVLRAGMMECAEGTARAPDCGGGVSGVELGEGGGEVRVDRSLPGRLLLSGLV